MFNYLWKNRIKLLEIKVARMEQEKACDAGKHEWELCVHSDNIPHGRCKHCYFHPKDKTDSKGGQS